MEVKISLPFPPRELSPNARVHWARKAKVIAAYRQWCGWAARVGDTGFLLPSLTLKPPVEATVTFVLPDKRRRDMDNLLASLKPMWDGLVDAGLLGDDSHDKLRLSAPQVRVEKGQQYVELALKEAQG